MYHGLLELSAIIVAGGAGLAVGWAVIDPGDRSRSEALADQVRAAGVRRTAVIVVGRVLTAEGFPDSHLYSTTRSRS